MPRQTNTGHLRAEARQIIDEETNNMLIDVLGVDSILMEDPELINLQIDMENELAAMSQPTFGSISPSTSSISSLSSFSDDDDDDNNEAAVQPAPILLRNDI